MFTKAIIGKMEIKNRLVRSATNESLAYANGDISNAYIDEYKKLAKNRIGLIITSHFSVDKDYCAHKGQAIMSEENDMDKLKQLTTMVHEYDAKIVAQINHPGNKSVGLPFDMNTASVETFQKIKNQFIHAAKLAKACHFDGVQIHMAHGYLFSMMSDPYQNTRDDQYGKNAEQRFQIMYEILSEIRKDCGEQFLLTVKMDANDSEGSDYSECLVTYGKKCEEAGCDAIELSGLGFAKYPKEYDKPYFLDEALLLKRHVNIPIILVGGFNSSDMIQKVLNLGVDFASISRPLIRQPELFTLNTSEQFTCIRCSKCFIAPKKFYKRCIFDKEEHPFFLKMYKEETQ